MFHLTRRERLLVVGLLLAFVTGLAVKHAREMRFMGLTPPAEQGNAKR